MVSGVRVTGLAACREAGRLRAGGGAGAGDARGAEPAARVGRRRRPDAGGWDECVRGVVDGSVLEISFRAVFHWIGRLNRS
jgi:hypothetical protein